jgi:hypothetical protein
MRGSTAFRAAVAPGGVLAGPWVKNELWRRAKAVPSLDLRFAENKSLRDAATGQQLVTFTRASSGTFTGSDGVLRTATTNLLLRSEEFDNASWNKLNTQAFGSGSVANAIAAPDGTTTADFLVDSTATGEHLVDQGFTAVSGTSYTFSVFIKPSANKTGVMLRYTSTVFGGITNQIQVVFATGAVTVLAGTPTGTATPLQDGWWRISITGTATANGSPSARVQFYSNNGTSTSYTGDGTSGYYLWGAQLEQSSTVGEYIPTTSTINSAPRFDHNPTTGESLGLLVEEQRTNLKTNSDAILSTNSYSVNNSTLTTATIATPTGSTTASLFTLSAGANTGNNGDGFNFGSAITLANSTAHAQSLFVKPAGATILRLRNNALGGTHDFTLTGNGTAPSVAGGLTSASITPFLNGWYRVSWTFTTTTSAPGNRSDYWAIKTDVADGTNGLYVVGAQLEAGAFPTSYIPTTTATVTRSADVASITGTAFSSWYRQDEGTVFVENSQSATTGDVAYSYYMDAGAGLANSIYSDVTSGNRRGVVFSGNVVQCASNFGAITTGVQARTAFGIKQDQFGLVLNGGMVASDNTGSVPSGISRLSLGNNTAASAAINGTIKRLVYWPRRLGNEVLQEVTR